MGGSTVWTLMSAAALAAAGLAAEPDRALEERVRAGNAAVAGLEARPPAEAARTLAERAGALEELIGRDPARALALALPEEALARLRRAYPHAASSLEERGAWTGPITEVFEDDFSNQMSRRLVWVRSGGASLDVHFAVPPGRPLRTGVVARIEGLRAGARIAATASAVTNSAAAPACSPLGEQKIAVLMVSFPGVANPWITLDAVRDTFFANPGNTGSHSLDSYWRDASYGKAWATGDVYGWLKLDRAYSCSESDAMRTAALNALSQRADPSRYNRFFIFFPGSCSAGAWGTEGCGADGSTAWFPLKGGVSLSPSFTGVLHEGGHNLGLYEVNGRDYGAETLGAPEESGVRTMYDDPFTGMGASRFSGHYNARQKLQLGWLDASQVVTAEGPGEYRIAPLGSGGGVKALKMRRPGTDGWFWLEYRQPSKPYESTLPVQVFNGALVHYEDAQNTQDGFRLHASATDLLDFTPKSAQGEFADPLDFMDPALARGTHWSDAWTPAAIEVTAADADGLTVRIADESCARLGEMRRLHGSGDETGEVAVFAPGDCQWSVRVSQPWVTLLSAESGAGNGTVSYRVAASGAAGERHATLAIGRQPFRITQSATSLPRAVGVFPESGTGYGQTFTFHFSHPGGVRRITMADAIFRDESRECTVRLRQPQAFPDFVAAELRTAWNEWIAGAALGENRTLENDVCALDLKASSFVRQGTEFYVRLALRFMPGFEGTKQVVAQAYELASATLVSAGPLLAEWQVGQRPGETPAIGAVLNSAAFASGQPAAPGEMVTIFGTGLGPAQIASTSYDASGFLENHAGGTRVLFDGVQAPLVYALSTQVAAVAPYGISGKTRVVVEFEGRASNEYVVDVAAAAPGIFRMGTGTQVVAVNPDGGLNSAERPAARGSEIAFYVTGEGQTSPPGIDGKLPEAQKWPAPTGDVQVKFGGVPGEVTFRGLLWAGVMQVNARIPDRAPAGGAVPLTVSVGGIESPAGATIAVR